MAHFFWYPVYLYNLDYPLQIHCTLTDTSSIKRAELEGSGEAEVTVVVTKLHTTIVPFLKGDQRVCSSYWGPILFMEQWSSTLAKILVMGLCLSSLHVVLWENKAELEWELSEFFNRKSSVFPVDAGIRQGSASPSLLFSVQCGSFRFASLLLQMMRLNWLHQTTTPPVCTCTVKTGQKLCLIIPSNKPI